MRSYRSRIDGWLLALVAGAIGLGLFVLAGVARLEGASIALPGIVLQGAVVALVASLPILFGPVPVGAKLLWSSGLAALALVRLCAGAAPERRAARIVTVATLAAAAYVLAMLATAVVGRRHVLAELARNGCSGMNHESANAMRQNGTVNRNT